MEERQMCVVYAQNQNNGCEKKVNNKQQHYNNRHNNKAKKMKFVICLYFWAFVRLCNFVSH